MGSVTATYRESRSINAIANLYLFSLAFVSVSIYLLVLFLKKHSWKNKFFWLPLLHLVNATIFVVIALNIIFVPVTDEDTLTGLNVVLYVVDAISTVSLGLAFFLRLTLLVNSAHSLGQISSATRYASWVLVVPALLFPISSIIGITCLFNQDLAAQADGKICQYITNSFNIAFNLFEVIMNSIFSAVLIKQAGMAPPAIRHRWILASVLLSLIPIVGVAGSVVSFFDAFIGTAISYCCWLIDNSAYLLMNRLLSKGFKSYGGSAQDHKTPPPTDKSKHS